MEDPTPIFPDGLMFQRPRDGAPNFVKGSISVKAASFVQFLRDMREKGLISEKGWINFDLKESKNKVLYFQVNTFKPKKKAEPTSPGFNGEEPITPSDIPF